MCLAAFVLNLVHSDFDIVSDFDLPAHASLGRVLQLPHEVRQEQIDAIMQPGYGRRVFGFSRHLLHFR
jgi:hypothetical protein